MAEISDIEELEPHKYQDIYFEEDVPFKDIGKITARRMIYFGLAMFLLIIILSIIIQVPRDLDLNFTLKGGVNELFFQYPEKIYIHKYYVHAGQHVKAGTPLLWITSEKIAGLIEDMETSQQDLELFTHQKKVAYQSDLDLLLAKKKGAEEELVQDRKELEITQTAKEKETKNLTLKTQTAQKQFDRNKELNKQGVISDFDLENSSMALREAEQLLISTREQYDRDIATLQGKIQQVQTDINLAEQEIKQKKADINLEEAQIRQHIYLSKRKLELNFGDAVIKGNGLKLLCPENGTITMLTNSESEVLPEQLVLRLRTDSLSFFAYAEASPADVGLLKEGLPVVLKYTTFPHYYYGSMKGIISSVSASPEASGNYPIRIKIVDYGKLRTRVKKGMTGTASVVVEKKPVFDYVFRVFLKKISID